MNLVEKKDEAVIAKELQIKQLELLRELDRVCKLLDIQYCLAYGTAIGAVRHKGFIPWDDDIDVYMKISDLERLQHNAHLFDYPFFLQHVKTDPGYGLIITRLRNSETALIEKTEVDRDINHGIFMDIYPLFNVPENNFRAQVSNFYAMMYRLMLYRVAPQNHGNTIKTVAELLLKITDTNIGEKIMQHCYKKIRNEEYSGMVSTYIWGEHNLSLPEDWIFPAKALDFEGFEVPVENKYDEYLTKIYGDYMELPPESERAFHHDYVCVDVERSYKHYKGKLYCKEK